MASTVLVGFRVGCMVARGFVGRAAYGLCDIASRLRFEWCREWWF